MNQTLELNSYRLLGCSGLRVSPLSLGAMTFGKENGWGSEPEEARRIFDIYVDRGGNFIDTSNFYTSGTSEKLLGEFSRGRRDRMVIATKYSLDLQSNDPNAKGNHRKNMMRSVEASLKRLGTDYIDLYYLHVWDATTPVEEVLRGMDDLVRSGKVVYVGISDTPAWQVSRMQAIADLRGWAPLIALQIEYSLLRRTSEREMMPMAQVMGLGVIPWSPLGGGVLSGKYQRSDLANEIDVMTRKGVVLANAYLTERNLVIADAVKQVAADIGKTPSQVALAWTLLNPAVTSPIIGARTVAQIEDNLGALDVTFTGAQRARLDEVSAIEPGFPHDMLSGAFIRTALGVDRIAPRRR